MGLPLGESGPKLLFDFGRITIQLVSGILIVILFSYQLSNELQQRIVYGYLVRGVSRSEYIFGKLLGSWLAVLLLVASADCLLAILVNAEVMEIRVGGSLQSSLGVSVWLQLFVAQAIHLWVLAALTLFVGSLSESFLFVCLISLLVWVTGSALLGSVTYAGGTEGFSLMVLKTIGTLVPQFQLTGLGDEMWYAGTLDRGSIVSYCIRATLHSICFFAVSHWVFRKREL